MKECEHCGRMASDNAGQISNYEPCVICVTCFEAEGFFECEECGVSEHPDEKSPHSDPICSECYSKLPSHNSEQENLNNGYRQGCGF